MEDKFRSITYFARPGRDNTAKVLEAVVARLAEGDIQTVVTASTTGYTALELAKTLGRSFTIVSVGETPLVREWGHEYPLLLAEAKAELERHGVIVADKVPYLFHSSVLDYSEYKAPTPEVILRETLYALGQGFKVAVEVVFLAVASGFIPPYQNVIAIGGTSRGADTAIVMNATFPNHAFSTDPNKRMHIYEILCKPL
jgi:hypothetical protein